MGSSASPRDARDARIQEAAAAIKALPYAVKAFTKIAPMVAPKLQTFAKFSTAIPVGLAGLGMLQARKYKTRNNPTARTSKRKIGDMEKGYIKKEQGDRRDDMIVAKPWRSTKTK